MITAFGKKGLSTNSDNEKTVIALNCQPPSVPVLSFSPSTCSLNNASVNLAWTNTTNTLNYEIRGGINPFSLPILINLDSSFSEFTSRTWRHANVATSTTYYYKITAYGPLGSSPTPSTIQSTTSPSCLPVTPSLTLSTNCLNDYGRVRLNWGTSGIGANTHHYDIYRQDSAIAPLHTENNTSTVVWLNNSLSSSASYNYKVEAVGYNGSIATDGYKTIITNNCSPLGSFNVTNDPPPAYCQGYYPRANLAWGASANAIKYGVNRYRLNSDDSIAQSFYNIA